MLPKSKVVKNMTGWYLEVRRAKTGSAVPGPIPDDLGKAFRRLRAKRRSGLAEATWKT